MSGRRGRGSGGGGHGGGGEERWLLPYSDMITLLLGLFIVLFAMSSIDVKKFRDVSRSLSASFHGAVLENSGGVLPSGSGVMNPAAESLKNDTTVVTQLIQAQNATNQNFDQEADELQKKLDNSNLDRDVKVVRDDRGITIRIAGDALFDTGSYKLKPAMASKLVDIAAELKSFGHEVEIEGHTDGQPCPGCHFGNRGLSGDRALEVSTLFEAHGFPGRLLSTKAMGSEHPLKKPPYKTADVRENRRIEIHVLAPGADDRRPASILRHNATVPAQDRIKGRTAPAVPIPSGRDLVQAEVDRGIVGELADTSRGTTP